MNISTSHSLVGPHLLVAVLGSALLVWAAAALTDLWLPTHASAPTPAPVVRPAPADEAAAEQQQAAERSRKMREREAVEQRERQLKAAEAERRRDEQRAAIMEERERKQEAWQKFYKPAKRCDNPPDNAAIVACSNAYIREQQRFEQLWAAGKLQAP